METNKTGNVSLRIHKEQRIFNYMDSALAQNGIRKFTIDKMALDLKMSKKTIYQLYPNKRTVLEEYFFHILHKFGNELEVLRKSDIDPTDKLIRFIYKIIKNIFPILQNYSWDLKSLYPEIWKKIEVYREETITNYMSIYLELEKKEYTNKNISPELFIYLLTNIIKGTIQPEFLQNEKWKTIEIIKGFILLIFQGALNTEISEKIEKIFNKMK